MNRLSLKSRILIGGTLFGMFFGAGNLIFPVFLGQSAGRNFIPAVLGFVITGVGLPMLGVCAIGESGANGLLEASSGVGKKYGRFFTCLLYLTIGPLFAIPRCATVAFSSGIAPVFSEGNNSEGALFAFTAIFFILVFLASLKSEKITLWIGKLINPIFLIALFLLLFVALFNFKGNILMGTPIGDYKENAFFTSLTDGYATMDGLAGLAFGIIVVKMVRDTAKREGLNHISPKREIAVSGAMAAIIMGLLYCLIIIMGAESRSYIPVSENGGAALASIAGHFFGRGGNVLLMIIIVLATLKTSIALISACSEAFLEIFKGKIKYIHWAVLFTVGSFLISNLGLTHIIEYSLPVLMLIYPPSIVLIILICISRLFCNDRRVYITTMIFTWSASFFDFLQALPGEIKNTLNLSSIISLGEKYLPLFNKNLGWVVPAALGLVLGLVIRSIKKQKVDKRGFQL